ncbi:hypothetical protein B0J18DRAFT_279987 [Chaetomium sp. MPI-SDFR-AT-0129]|nr:hypothetical protein B0J18DRAFT_279987 [Chaetomium sp. MPI-SDFR-AT-0129]
MPPPLSTTSTTNLKVAAAPKRPTSRQATRTTGNTLPGVPKEQPSAGILTTGTTAAGKRTARITTTTTTAYSTVATATDAVASASATANTPPVSRHLLRSRDQNAPPPLPTVRLAPEAAKSLAPTTAARMPSYDRPSVAGPRQPAVGRSVNKQPLTPKIAARTIGSQQQAPALATPLVRRSTAESNLTATGNGARDRDDLVSPGSAFLNANVTPRSGPRQNRVDGANTTPSSTPNADRPDPMEMHPGLVAAGVDDTQRGPTVALNPALEIGSRPRQDQDSKFFYASDAQKSTTQPVATTRPIPQHQPKSSTFFYANGNTLPERQNQNAPPRPFSPPSTAPSPQESISSKFVYANGTPGLQPPAKIGPSAKRGSGSVVSTAPIITNGKQQANAPRGLPPLKSPQQVGSSASTPALVSPRSPTSTVNPHRLSLGKIVMEQPSSRPPSQTFSKSVTVVDPPANTRRISSHGSFPSAQSSGSTSPSLPPTSGPALPSSPVATGFASLLQAAEDFAETETEEDQPESLSSPAKTPQDDPVKELVANARRERKVQDLQITNASLEAINRTLERQLRKQTAEIRRYQRLSRSGYLNTSSMNKQTPSEPATDGAEQAQAGAGLDDLLGEESGSETGEVEAELERLDEPDEEDESSGSEDSGEVDPATAERRHEKRRQEERRLDVDLSKHQQLLVDSQKINQSLKKCLGWTEELIKEGKRALEYKVRVSDVELGGRVLAPEEIERRAREEDDELGDVTLGEETIYAIDAFGRSSFAAAGGGYEHDDDADTTITSTTTWSKDTQDRDSGIELAPEGVA